MIQYFACHGLMDHNMQQVITNEVNLDTGFYKTIKAEHKIRKLAQQTKNCYFLTAFASVRENLNGRVYHDWYGSNQSEEMELPHIDVEDLDRRSEFYQPSVKREGNDQVADCKIANFTFIFGNFEGKDLRIDPHQARKLVNFLTSQFSPSTGNLRIPHVFDHSNKLDTGFETLTSSLGQSLVLQKAEDFVGIKTAFIVQSSLTSVPVERTRSSAVSFLRNDLGFSSDEIIVLTVHELLCK